MFKKILKTLTGAPRERERERERESKRLKPFAALLSTTSSPRGRRYKCGQLVAQQLLMRGQKTAFTLAEVLITLAVIGIVAALTIGVFLPKIHSTIRARQIATAEVKFTKAMEQMALNNAIGPYYETTQEFVDELQNYLKISKVCDNDNLTDCFGYEKIKISDDKEFEIKDIKDGKSLGMTDNDTDYAETIGIVTIDGTSMILSWDKKCKILEPKVYQWGGNTNETTSCVAIVMDINGNNDVNRLNKDVALFRANGLKDPCGVKFSYNNVDYCWGVPFPTADIPLMDDDCAQNKSTYGITNCVDSSHSNQDCWGGAMKKCKTEGKRLPSQDELLAFAKYLYGNDNILASSDTYNLTMNTTALSSTSNILASALDSNGWFNLWSGVESSKVYSAFRTFYPTHTGYFNRHRYYLAVFGVCVGD